MGNVPRPRVAPPCASAATLPAIIDAERIAGWNSNPMRTTSTSMRVKSTVTRWQHDEGAPATTISVTSADQDPEVDCTRTDVQVERNGAAVGDNQETIRVQPVGSAGSTDG